MEKRPYIKPAISFQTLAVTEASSGCEMLCNSTEMSCPVTIPDWGMTYFQDGMCDLLPVEQICYHVPVADNNVFSS